MKKVRYDGEDSREIPSLGKTVSKGDVIEVEDDFDSFGFSLVAGKFTPTETPSVVPTATKEVE